MSISRYDDYDFSSRRSIKIIEPDDIRSSASKRAVIDFFYHDGRFWTAVLSLDAVKQVFGQAFNFSHPRTKETPDGPAIVYDHHGLPVPTIASLNHLQSRFVMDRGSPVELYELGHRDFSNAEPVCRIDDFVYSIEAVGPPGIRFNFWDGLLGRLIATHRFLSTQEMVFERISVEGQHVVQSAALPINREEASLLLRRSLARSDKAGTTEKYYLYRICGTNNCTTSPFKILDKTVKYSFRHWLGSFLYRIPFRPRFYLRIRGLDSDPAHIGKLREEFAEYLQSAEVRQRRRAYVRNLIRQKRKERDSG